MFISGAWSVCMTSSGPLSSLSIQSTDGVLEGLFLSPSSKRDRPPTTTRTSSTVPQLHSLASVPYAIL